MTGIEEPDPARRSSFWRSKVSLATFSTGFAIVAALRFGVEEAKLSWA